MEGAFTLIELLVVVAILSLLASLIAASLSESRMKGRDAAKNESVRQVVNALELYRSEHATYPSFGNGLSSIDTNSHACLGYASGESSCFGVYAIDGDDILNAALAPYFGGTVPKDAKPIPATSGYGDLQGVLYACASATDCGSYVLRWHLEGVNRTCGIGFPEGNYGGTTRCAYRNK